MTKDEIKAGDRINTPKGMGTVKFACGGYLTVMLDNGEWWVDMNAILPKEDNPTDEIEVDAEAKEPKFKRGDKVILRKFNGVAVKAGSIGEVWGMNPVCKHCYDVAFDGGGLTLEGKYLELYNEPTDEIKVGDRVVAYIGPNMEWFGTVQKIIPDTDGLYGENLLEIRVDGGCLLQHRVSRCAKIDSSNEAKPNDNTITIPVKADFGEDVGFALLDRALELQKKHTELEGEIKRLYELVSDAMNGLHPLRLTFDNSFLSRIACMVCCDFRPLTAEEKAQFRIDIKNMADNPKKQSE